MKKTFMALALTLLPFGMASAQVRMLVVPKDGGEAKSFNLDDIRHIDFLGDGNTFSVECATDRWSFDFDKVRCLKLMVSSTTLRPPPKRRATSILVIRRGGFRERHGRCGDARCNF